MSNDLIAISAIYLLDYIPFHLLTCSLSTISIDPKDQFHQPKGDYTSASEPQRTPTTPILPLAVSRANLPILHRISIQPIHYPRAICMCSLLKTES
jgi:hypothetical protein